MIYTHTCSTKTLIIIGLMSDVGVIGLLDKKPTNNGRMCMCLNNRQSAARV